MTTYNFDINGFSDLHKDVYGFRPSVDHNFYNVNDAERQIIWDNMVDELDHVIKRCEEREKEAIENFESRINDIIDIGADDRETAIRWILESYDTYDTPGYICWDLELPYSYEVYFENIMSNA